MDNYILMMNVFTLCPFISRESIHFREGVPTSRAPAAKRSQV